MKVVATEAKPKAVTSGTGVIFTLVLGASFQLSDESTYERLRFEP